VGVSTGVGHLRVVMRRVSFQAMGGDIHSDESAVETLSIS
jgi:hypothetical protein